MDEGAEKEGLCGGMKKPWTRPAVGSVTRGQENGRGVENMDLGSGVLSDWRRTLGVAWVDGVFKSTR